MTANLRRFMLTLHIIFAVGWLGAVAGFLILAIVGLTSRDGQTVQSVYLSMGVITRFIIVPLSFAPLITGPILSLGTPWGLFRHYWILAKLLLTVVSTIIMQLHVQPINLLAGTAAKATLLPANLHDLQVQMVIASALALVVLIVETALAVYKPRGMTAYGWRKQDEQRAQPYSMDE
jgi:uncharacterized membrane protein